ncbi:Regulation of nuclear pre-mRNA domain-containing protein isoform 1 [Schistosoma japonicum]|uniref:Regulation of nuclear pre-mRNA domain-containing protein isoform 1 n=1 Tax=Schistosoma japonicum TaxID=6182 RepID=A0A4Z2CRA5_SCHJA|nr:Regulation of nuclear pre-mRNA domain-containing protein isoform 1 [Schistosoma japonicum]
MDPNSLLKDQIRHKLEEVTLSSKHVKDAASFLLTQAEHSDFISSQWLEIFRNTNDPSFQLALLYVANEILTKSPKYGVSEFGEALKPVVIQATQFLKPGPFISKLTKLINYWTYRKVFDIKFTEQLLRRLTATEQVDRKNLSPLSRYNPDDMVKNFSPEKLLDTLRKIKQLDEICESHGKFDISPLGFGSPIMSTVSSLKSKEESRTLTAQVDKCCKHLEFIHKKYEERLEQMSALLSILEGAEIYYNVQLKEVAVVVNAYGTYGKRVTKTLSQLHDLFHKDHISSPTNTTTLSQHQAKSNVNAHDQDEQTALLKQSTKYNRENSLNEPCYSGDEYYDDLEGDLTHADDDNDDIGRGGGVSYHGNEDHDDDNNYYQRKDGSKINQSPNIISQKITSDSLTSRISNQSTNIFNLPDNNSPTKLTDKPIHLNTLQSSCSKSEPFGFPIFQPVYDSSGDVDYRVLLNPTLSKSASNDDNLRSEMNQSVELQRSAVNNLDSSEVSPTHSLSNKSKMNHHHDNCTVHTNYSDKSKNVHKTHATSMNAKDTFVGHHHSQHRGTPDKPSHSFIEDEEDNMEVSDGDEPDANDSDDRILDDKKVNLKDRPVSTTVCSQLDKDWRLLTQQVKYDIKSAIRLPHTSTANDNVNSSTPIPSLSPKNSVELIHPTPPRLPTASPIRIPPPPPPPLVGLDPYSFSPPPPLPSALNELAYQVPLTKSSDLFIPQPPVAPTIPSVPLDLKQINMMMMLTTNDSEKTVEQPQSCINSSEMIQSQNYSPNDLLKNLFQPPPIISKSPSLLLSPSISLFSNLVATASTTQLTTCPSSTDNAMNSLPSSGSSSSCSSSIPVLSNIQQGMMNTLSCIENLPMVNKFDASAPASSSSCELNTIQQNTNRHLEDPFAVISRLTGLSNLMKNIPTQSNLLALPITPVLSNPPPGSFNETPTTTSSDSCWKTNVIHDSLSLSSINNDLKPTYCLQPIMTSTANTTISTTNSYTPHAKRSRFSDIVTNVENNNIIPSTTSLAVNTSETISLSCPISSTSSDDLLLPSSKSEKSSIFNCSTNVVDHCTGKKEDKQQVQKSLSPDNDNLLRSRSNSISDSNSSAGGETPTLDERQDDLLSVSDQDRSLMSFHAFGTPTSSLADFLIPSTCHATDPKSFLQNIPNSVTPQTSVISSLTRSYGLPFSCVSNSAHSNTSSIPVNPINLPPSQLSMMRPTMLITNNNPNLPVSNSQFPGLTHSSMMFYEPTRMPITPRPLMPGSILMTPTQTRPAAVSQGNVRLPTTPFCGPPNWTQPLGVDQSTALQRPPPNDFWALMSSVPPPPPPPPVHPNVPQLPAFSSLNPTHHIHPVVGMFNPNSWMFTSPSTNNRDKQ